MKVGSLNRQYLDAIDFDLFKLSQIDNIDSI